MEIDEIIVDMLDEYSDQVYGFTKKEFEILMKYDSLSILSLCYSVMNADMKGKLRESIEGALKLQNMESEIENLAVNLDSSYIPLTCRMVDPLADSAITKAVFKALFEFCTGIVNVPWSEYNSFSNYLVLYDVVFFEALAKKLRITDAYTSCMDEKYSSDSYEDFVENLYDRNMNNLEWDTDVDLDILESVLEEAEEKDFIEETDEEECLRIHDEMEQILLAHRALETSSDECIGIDYIVSRTEITKKRSAIIHGFECWFCDSGLGEDEYIIVYQGKTRIVDLIDKEDDWARFQHDLYYEDIRENKNSGMVYIVYILDEDSDNIPIQVIESNKKYGRKYVFTEDETITFINGIVRSKTDDGVSSSPVQDWYRILREVHLTGCLTEPYSAKKVESYLNTGRFDSEYVVEDELAGMASSDIPHIKWVKSIDTSGFRDFCFDGQTMDFGQINLFYGANGSGKTSVLEGIEYALTAEVRRVKDFKVKMPDSTQPCIQVYDREAGIHSFTPQRAKKNNKEIERVWYGVPIGRTKSNLNDNFNRFNSFDSEAAYKFIHDSKNKGDDLSSMFGNLMFGETVVDHEKKWRRFKEAFEKKYSEVREETGSAKFWVELYEESIKKKEKEQKASKDLEEKISEINLKSEKNLPSGIVNRYSTLFSELSLVEKYVDELYYQDYEDYSFKKLAQTISNTKKTNLEYTKEIKKNKEAISSFLDENAKLKEKNISLEEEMDDYRERISIIERDVNNWEIVCNVLGHEDTIQRVDDLTEEHSDIEHKLYAISQIEQHPNVIRFLKSEDHDTDTLSDTERKQAEKKLALLREEKEKIERNYELAKSELESKDKLAIELRELGKKLVSDETCPLCGHKHDSMQHLREVIENSVVIDDSMEKTLSKIEDLSGKITRFSTGLRYDEMVKSALQEMKVLSETIYGISEILPDYDKLYQFVQSKDDLESKKEDILEELKALDRQGFSQSNIQSCRQYTSEDPTYLRYMKEESDISFAEFLQKRFVSVKTVVMELQGKIDKNNNTIEKNRKQEELKEAEIERLESQIDELDMESNRSVETALEAIKQRFVLDDEETVEKWIKRFRELYDLCELEVERMDEEGSISDDRRNLKEYQDRLKELEVESSRCSAAMSAFESMRSLSSYVESGIRGNIEQISKFFKWMHHSGEFIELGIDDGEIYAVRGVNDEAIKLYEMSTGQRATIAMAVMLALHLAAPDAPQFLLLDEPLATMDDTQVLNVLDIFKSLAAQGTQIFFTTANGIMIDLFKQCFKKTELDYKEFEFIKRVNRPSEITEHSINDVKTIEELTLDDLTLDFTQFAEIRETLKRNQDKLVSWEEDIERDNGANDEKIEKTPESETEKTGEPTDGYFYSQLTDKEKELFSILVYDKGKDPETLKKALSDCPVYKLIYDSINEKALDYLGETIIENDDIPWMDEEYKREFMLEIETLNTRV